MIAKKDLALTLAAVIAAGLALAPTAAQAQFRTRRDDGYRDDYRRDDRRDLRGLVDDAERQSNAFRAWFERNYDRRRLGREHDNRWLKGEIQSLDETMERLRRHAGDRGRSRDNVEEAMDHARRIDHELVLGGDRDTRFTVREWVDLRLTLDSLARAYGVRRF